MRRSYIRLQSVVLNSRVFPVKWDCIESWAKINKMHPDVGFLLVKLSVFSASLSHSLPWFWVIVGDGTSRVCCSILLNIMFYMTRLSGWVEGFKYHTLSAFALTTLITFILQCQRLCVGNINLSFSHSLPSLPSLLLLIYFQPQASNQSLLG